MTANKPMTGEQLDELMTVAVNFQRESEKAGERACATFAYAVQVAVLELRKARNDSAALVGMEAEPVDWQIKCANGGWLTVGEDGAKDATRDGYEVRPLYAEQPSITVVLKDHQVRDLVNELRDIAIKYHAAGQLREHISRSIRAAMLQGKAEPRDSVRRDHAEWSQSTFGNVGPVGPLKHLSKEALEAAAEPGDLSEWADMQFLLWDAQRRSGITDDQITKAMIEKLAVNKTRLWPEPKDGEPRLHIKAAPQQEVKP